MDLFYRILLFAHILSVIVSIGPFFILLPIVKKLRIATETQIDAYLDAFRFAVRLSKHSGHILVLTGILLVFSGPWTWSTPWIVATLVILFGSLLFLARAFSPTLKKFQDQGEDREKLIDKLKKSILIYLFLLMSMLWFMVVKPYLW